MSRQLSDDLSYDPWLAVELPLPAELDAEALRAVRRLFTPSFRPWISPLMNRRR